MEVVVSVVAFVSAGFLQVILHRVLFTRGVRSAKTFLVYPIGSIALLAWLLTATDVSLPMSAFFLYLLLSAVAVIFFITPVLGDTAPTSRILSYLREHRRASARSLVQLFSDKEMIEKRLDDLRAAGLVRVHGGRYTASTTGKLVARAVRGYLALIAWEPSA